MCWSALSVVLLAVVLLVVRTAGVAARSVPRMVRLVAAGVEAQSEGSSKTPQPEEPLAVPMEKQLCGLWKGDVQAQKISG